MPKNNCSELEAGINQIIEELRADGTLKQLSEKYFGHRYHG